MDRQVCPNIFALKSPTSWTIEMCVTVRSSIVRAAHGCDKYDNHKWSHYHITQYISLHQSDNGIVGLLQLERRPHLCQSYAQL